MRVPSRVADWPCYALSASWPRRRAATEQSPGRWNVVELGAVPNRSADSTAVFQKALDAAGKAGGGIVEVPAGRFRINGTLSIPARRHAAGHLSRAAHRGPTHGREARRHRAAGLRGPRQPRKGPPFIRLAGRNSAIAGLVVDYPEWKATDVPPVPYPPCVGFREHRERRHPGLLLPQSLRGDQAGPAHRHLVRNVTGYPSKRGIFVDECYDIGHIENVHFWPFGVAYKPDDPYCKWVNTQGVAFELARTDWHYVSNTFCFGYGVGYKFSESKARQHQRQLPRAGRRFVPPRGAGRAGPAARAADHQRRVRRPLEQHRFGLPGDRPEGARAR